MQINRIKNIFFKPLAKFHQWYDNLDADKRFIMMLTLVITPWLIMDILGMVIDHSGVELLGMLWILIMIVYRFWWISGGLKKYV